MQYQAASLAVEQHHLNTFEILNNEGSVIEKSKYVDQNHAIEVNDIEQDNRFFYIYNIGHMSSNTQPLKGPQSISDQRINKITMGINEETSVNDKMKYELYRKSYLHGNPIIVNFTLHNLTNEDLWVLRWYTPLEGIKGKIFRVSCDGHEIPYIGPMVKRAQPTMNDYVHIDPRRSVSHEVDLSSVYDLPLYQQCVVQFSGKIYDFVASSDLIPKMTGEHQMVNITGNSASFSIKSS